MNCDIVMFKKKKKPFYQVPFDEDHFRKLSFIRTVYAQEHAGQVFPICLFLYAAVDFMYDAFVKYIEEGESNG